jgi:glycosyltransferase involved in cell wall biosynthesis
MPVYNVEKYVGEAIDSVLNQTFPDFELLIIDDESPDNSIDICRSYNDPRIRIIQQKNLGLAGARNTGINHAKGQYIAFLDADDYWAAEKLALHLEHLHQNPEIGVSFCPSIFIDDDGKLLGIKQTPKLTNIKIEDVFCRNPIGNGSAPFIRKSVFENIAFFNYSHEILRHWYFDERLKQSEDIDCWLRIATQTDWGFEGIKPALTYYRVNNNGLSANVVNQFDSWKRARKNLQTTAPDCVAQWGKLAEAYQLRYLCRRAIRSRDSSIALKLALMSIKTNFKIIFKEPLRTLNTLCCAVLINLLPSFFFCRLESLAMQSVAMVNNLKTSTEH